MSLGTANNRNDYIGTGTASVYSYTYRITSKTHLLVTVKNTSGVESTLVLDTDYSVSDVGEVAGGNITLIDSGQAWLSGGNLITDYTITVRRVVPLLQETDIRNQGDFYPEVHEDQFDYQTFISQQHQDEIDRSVKLPESTPASAFDPTLPTDIADADPGSAIITTDTADGWRVGPTASEIENAQANAVAAAASASAASSSETNAAASESASAQSAIDAANAVEAAQWTDVRFITFADSPVNIVEADSGTMFSVDPTGGVVVFNLPEIGTMTDINPWSVGIKKAVMTANDITVNRAGTDEIDDGQTSVTITALNSGKILIPEDSTTPDSWTTINFNNAYFESLILENLSTPPTTPGAGTLKVYAQGDIPYTKDSSGTERELGGLPAGSITMFGGTSAPTGWLFCDGSSVNRVTYAALFTAIGTAYGTADGSSFNLPDFRGAFPRGVDNGKGLDPNAGSRSAAAAGGNTGDNVGSFQDDAYESHNHTSPAHTHTTNPHTHDTTWRTGDIAIGGAGPNTLAHQEALSPNGATSTGTQSNNGTSGTAVTINASGGSETRPVNLGVNFIIKI